MGICDHLFIWFKKLVHHLAKVSWLKRQKIFINSMMELFSRRIWTTRSAQQSNMYSAWADAAFISYYWRAPWSNPSICAQMYYLFHGFDSCFNYSNWPIDAIPEFRWKGAERLQTMMRTTLVTAMKAMKANPPHFWRQFWSRCTWPTSGTSNLHHQLRGQWYISWDDRSQKFST